MGRQLDFTDDLIVDELVNADEFAGDCAWLAKKQAWLFGGCWAPGPRDLELLPQVAPSKADENLSGTCPICTSSCEREGISAQTVTARGRPLVIRKIN